MVALNWTIASLLLATIAYSAPLIHPRASAAIIDDLNTINTDTTALQSALSAYKGGLFSALPIQNANEQLTKDINNAIASGGYYGFASEQESQQALSFIYYTLAPNVEATAALLSQKKDFFVADKLSERVLQSLQALRSASYQYGQILASKNPGFADANARIDAALAGVLAAYSY
ncbi:Putative Cell wall mannoprotein [Septoria linicola]|uniref:Cell wall mannoprotein n=1 Tax=Septoria linicola TaxID=215465 RepID=A0A9Q9AT03_9PEZI|nr:putative Cell wall mannoprotein [Septoria linicola]USW52643.1 Putative Cell wall mannoprotein [Septoria linicola]